MCMSSTTFTMKKDKKGEFYGIGYKYIGKDMRSMGAKFRIGRWVNDNRKANIEGYPDYAAGFHILTSLKDAKDMFGTYDIYQVYFKEVVATGVEWGSNKEIPCIIARQIKVVKLIS